MVQISSDWANLKYALYGITLFAAVTIIVEQVLVTDNRVFNRPLSCTLRSFARTAHSLRSAMLAWLTRSVHRLAHSLRSLPRGTVKILEYVFML